MVLDCSADLLGHYYWLIFAAWEVYWWYLLKAVFDYLPAEGCRVVC